MSNNYRIVLYVEELGLQVYQVAEENLGAWCDVRGFKVTGINNNPRHRAELQNQPIISGLCGPMWDGDAVRYEDTRAYAILSE